MTTFHEEAAETLLDDIMQTPEAAATLAHHRAVLTENRNPRWAARIGQTHHHPRSWPLEQAAAHLAVHSALMTGRYVDVLIGVGAAPGPDADREGNALKLARVNKHFRADLDMTQNGRESDGRLSWSEPISTDRSTNVGLITDCGTTPVRTSVTLPPGGVPLEVGTSKPSTTLMHLRRFGGVARWAYGDDLIALFVDVTHPWFRPIARVKAGT